MKRVEPAMVRDQQSCIESGEDAATILLAVLLGVAGLACWFL